MNKSISRAKLNMGVTFLLGKYYRLHLYYGVIGEGYNMEWV
jgi:hypothetical protein